MLSFSECRRKAFSCRDGAVITWAHMHMNYETFPLETTWNLPECGEMADKEANGERTTHLERPRTKGTLGGGYRQA